MLKLRHFFHSNTIDIFLISPQNHVCGYSLEVPHQVISNVNTEINPCPAEPGYTLSLQTV